MVFRGRGKMGAVSILLIWVLISVVVLLMLWSFLTADQKEGTEPCPLFNFIMAVLALVGLMLLWAMYQGRPYLYYAKNSALLVIGAAVIALGICFYLVEMCTVTSFVMVVVLTVALLLWLRPSPSPSSYR